MRKEKLISILGFSLCIMLVLPFLIGFIFWALDKIGDGPSIAGS